LAAIRTLNRLELVLATLRAALNQLREAEGRWVRGWVPLEWYDLYALRAESYRRPKERSTRDALAVQMGADGYALMDAI
jgi:transposase